MSGLMSVLNPIFATCSRYDPGGKIRHDVNAVAICFRVVLDAGRVIDDSDFGARNHSSRRIEHRPADRSVRRLCARGIRRRADSRQQQKSFDAVARGISSGRRICVTLSRSTQENPRLYHRLPSKNKLTISEGSATRGDLERAEGKRIAAACRSACGFRLLVQPSRIQHQSHRVLSAYRT